MANLVPYSQSIFNKSRKDKFLLILNLPKGLKGIDRKINRSDSTIKEDSLQFSVYGSIVPNIEIPATPLRYAGQTLHTSSLARPPYPPLTINFTVDNRFNNYWVIYKWLNILNDSKTGTYDNNDIMSNNNKSINNEYASNLSIFSLDEYDKRVIEFTYTNAFPTSLAGIDYNNRDAGEIETSATFNYSQFHASLVESVDSL